MRPCAHSISASKRFWAKSYARIHRANLINTGIIPILFKDAADYEHIVQGDRIEMKKLFRGIDEGELDIQVFRKDGSRKTISVMLPLFTQEKEMLRAGGALNYASLEK